MIKNKQLYATLLIGVFLVLILILWTMLLLSCSISNEAIRENYEKSALSYKQADAFQHNDNGRMNALADNYADAILLNVAWHMGEGNPIRASVDADYYNGEDFGVNAGLYLAVTENVSPNTDYSRYWHGSAALVRLFHLFTDVSGIRIIGLTTVLLMVLLTMLWLVHNHCWDIALMLGISLAAVQVWNIGLSMEYQPAFVLTFLLCPLYLLAERRGDNVLPLLSVAGGCAVAFFDFLTTETMTILMPLLLVAAVRAKERRLTAMRDSLCLFGFCILCWGTAYVGAFLLKWTLATLLTGENAFVLALSSAGERIGGEVTEGTAAPTTIFSSIAANLTVLFGGIARVELRRVFLGLVLSLGIFGSVWYLFRKKESDREAALLLLILGMVVFLRYLVLNNHSYLHEFFTYRALIAPIFALLTALRLNISLPQKKTVSTGKRGRR